jgi:hypothetical protein
MDNYRENSRSRDTNSIGFWAKSSLSGRAHEIGHILMDIDRHSEAGLMQADWKPEGMDAMNLGASRSGPVGPYRARTSSGTRA